MVEVDPKDPWLLVILLNFIGPGNEESEAKKLLRQSIGALSDEPKVACVVVPCQNGF